MSWSLLVKARHCSIRINPEIITLKRQDNLSKWVVCDDDLVPAANEDSFIWDSGTPIDLNCLVLMHTRNCCLSVVVVVVIIVLISSTRRPQCDGWQRVQISFLTVICKICCYSRVRSKSCCVYIYMVYAVNTGSCCTIILSIVNTLCPGKKHTLR